MTFPNFDACVICDIIRPELGGKSILIGYYGVTPNVDITIQDINRGMMLSILPSCPPAPETNEDFQYVMSITRPDGLGIFQSPALKIVHAPGKRLNFPLAFNIAPPILPGRYSIRITVNGDVKLDTWFSVRVASPTEVNRTSAPAAGAPN